MKTRFLAALIFPKRGFSMLDIALEFEFGIGDLNFLDFFFSFFKSKSTYIKLYVFSGSRYKEPFRFEDTEV